MEIDKVIKYELILKNNQSKMHIKYLQKPKPLLENIKNLDNNYPFKVHLNQTVPTLNILY